MKLKKRILKSRPVQLIICWIAYLYVLFVYKTTKWEVRGTEKMDTLAESGQPFILVFWHGRLLMIPTFAPKKIKINIVISQHNDGELISNVVKHFNFSFIRGSSQKDSVAALKNTLKALKNNEMVALTPDGPRGPRMRIGGNVIQIAKMLSVPIIPITYSVEKCKILRSWDRFMVAKPFNRGILICGDPIFVDKKDEKKLKIASDILENQLNNMTRIADEFVGIKPIEPEVVNVNPI